MNLKHINTLVVIVFFTIYGNAQSDEIVEASETNQNTITVSTSASIWRAPDETNIIITLTEYVHTDPTTQQTKAIELAEIKKTLFEKLTAINISKSDLKFTDINETNNYNYGNMYNNQYNTTQKKSLSASYTLKWTNSEEELQKLFEALRFNGVSLVRLSCDFSEELQEEIQHELIEKCIKNAKRDATTIAIASEVDLGEMKSYSNYQNTYQNVQPVYYNNMNYYQISLSPAKHTLQTTVTYAIQ